MRYPVLLTLIIGPWLASCGSDDLPPMAGTTTGNDSQAAALFQEGRQAEDSGDSSRAIKRYDKLADDHPWDDRAPEARFRQAQLLEGRGDTIKAFEAYQDLIVRYRGSNLYTQALDRQAAMAQAAADGEIKTSFLGMKSRLSTTKVVEMLEKVRDNAPASPTASRAQFGIAELYQSRGEAAKSIAAYRQLVRDYPSSREAAEGQYRIGVILTQEAERGNQDQANLDLAREAFQDYLQNYPGHAKNADARKQLNALGYRDVQRSLDVAEFYYKKGQMESAKFYYREVLRQAGSGELHDRAKARLAELGE